MSITFFAEITTTVAQRVYSVTCDNGQEIGQFTGYAVAYSEAQAHSLVCTIDLCQVYGADVDEVETVATPLAVNMNTRNAVDVLRTLGLAPAVDDEPYGDMDARAFLNLVGTAIEVGVTDNGLDTIDAVGGGMFAGDYRMVDCGRESGYLMARLNDLADLGRKCLAVGARVCWA